ncbi:MAG: hypothetical protein UT36_C0004G0085 [Candidatus Peregrinibacteria bacterium GW2011_GWF2_39_17]|nr:MAG: hypothetical protein UT36_C0004G0085 [Candidatus Peregrinibacteria bacterium GW2011_GWF2_39_17]HCW32227.1 RNA-binding protein [Candidatus Peregrinibacteria bacterium]
MSDPSIGADRDFIEYVVKQLVDDPTKVIVTRTVDEMGVLITLQVSSMDMGKVIGKSGQTAKALRILLRVIGSKNHARVNLKIVEPDGHEVAPEEITTEKKSSKKEKSAILEEEIADQHADLPDDLTALNEN